MNRFTVLPGDLEELYFAGSQREEDCIGHLRGDFGAEGNNFWTSWWPHTAELYNDSVFKAEFDELVAFLRCDMLKSLSDMKDYVGRHPCLPLSETMPAYGYRVLTKRYDYYIKCRPVKGDYQVYIYCYLSAEHRAGMQRYGVIFTRCGYAEIEAVSKDEAQHLADEKIKDGDVSWDDDWPCTDTYLLEEGDTIK